MGRHRHESPVPKDPSVPEAACKDRRVVSTCARFPTQGLVWARCYLHAPLPQGSGGMHVPSHGAWRTVDTKYLSLSRLDLHIVGARYIFLSLKNWHIVGAQCTFHSHKTWHTAMFDTRRCLSPSRCSFGGRGHVFSLPHRISPRV